MSKTTLRIGTRGSKLALYQAEQVKKVLEDLDSSLLVELKIISTKGDEVLDVALSKIGDKGLFTKELEVAMLNGEVDMAVHSLKDLQTDLAEPFQLAGVLPRANFRDALVSRNHKKLSEFTSNDRIATSSLRRKAGLLHINRHFQIIDIRGNVNTRLKKMEEGYCDAIIMAAAGLERLGLERYITEIIEPDTMIPAVSQGVIAIETRSDNTFVNQIISKINHLPTWNEIIAERAFMRTLQGGCQVPVGCYTKSKGETMEMIGFVSSVDGEKYILENVSGQTANPESLGILLAQKIISKGGDAVLREVRNLNG
jgi:hydroxymethylbilane synthase